MKAKEWGAVGTAIVSILASIGLAIGANGTANTLEKKTDGVGERIRAVEVRYEDIKARLDRIEGKIDRLKEGGK